MTLGEVIDRAGGGTAFGQRLEPPVTNQAVSKWRRQGWVPYDRAFEIEEKFEGVAAIDILSPRYRERARQLAR